MTEFDSKGTRNVVRSTLVVVNVLVYVSLRPRSTGVGGWAGEGEEEKEIFMSVLFFLLLFSRHTRPDITALVDWA